MPSKITYGNTEYEFEKNIKLDAYLVHAAMHGAFIPAAIQTFDGPSEAFARAEWLKQQPKEYIQQVADEVSKLHGHH